MTTHKTFDSNHLLCACIWCRFYRKMKYDYFREFLRNILAFYFYFSDFQSNCFEIMIYREDRKKLKEKSHMSIMFQYIMVSWHDSPTFKNFQSLRQELYIISKDNLIVFSHMKLFYPQFHVQSNKTEIKGKLLQMGLQSHCNWNPNLDIYNKDEFTVNATSVTQIFWRTDFPRYLIGFCSIHALWAMKHGL